MVINSSSYWGTYEGLSSYPLIRECPNIKGIRDQWMKRHSLRYVWAGSYEGFFKCSTRRELSLLLIGEEARTYKPVSKKTLASSFPIIKQGQWTLSLGCRSKIEASMKTLNQDWVQRRLKDSWLTARTPATRNKRDIRRLAFNQLSLMSRLQIGSIEKKWRKKDQLIQSTFICFT